MIDAARTPADVTGAYERRAAEYSDMIGSMDAAHPVDRALVDTWAAAVDGPVVDAGCGPGHWTDHLAGQGRDAWGVDLTPAFITRARASYPSSTFHLASLDHLPAADGTVGGVLAWFSLIHRAPTDVPAALVEFRRVLRDPDGRLLLGFFEGPAVEPFDHAVVTAYRWPVDAMCELVTAAGFTVAETHVTQRRGERPHAVVAATRQPDERPLRR